MFKSGAGYPIEQEFLLELHDYVIDAILYDSRIKAACSKTNTEVILSKKIVHKHIFSHKYIRYGVVKVKSPDINSFNSCIRLIEDVFPPFAKRVEYVTRPIVTLRHKGLMVPDNMELYYPEQRLGISGNNCGALNVNSPYQISDQRGKDKAPWKVLNEDAAGMVVSYGQGSDTLLGFYGGLDDVADKALKGEAKVVHYFPTDAKWFESGTEVQKYRVEEESRPITPSLNVNKFGEFNSYEAANIVTPIRLHGKMGGGVTKYYRNLIFGKLGAMKGTIISDPRDKRTENEHATSKSSRNKEVDGKLGVTKTQETRTGSAKKIIESSNVGSLQERSDNTLSLIDSGGRSSVFSVGQATTRTKKASGSTKPPPLASFNKRNASTDESVQKDDPAPVDSTPQRREDIKESHHPEYIDSGVEDDYFHKSTLNNEKQPTTTKPQVSGGERRSIGEKRLSFVNVSDAIDIKRKSVAGEKRLSIASQSDVTDHNSQPQVRKSFVNERRPSIAMQSDANNKPEPTEKWRAILAAKRVNNPDNPDSIQTAHSPPHSTNSDSKSQCINPEDQ